MPAAIGSHSTAQDSAFHPFTIQLLTSSAELEGIAPDWLALLHSDPQSTPFQSPDWLIPWWEHVGEGELHCLAARDPAGVVDAFLPLYIYTQPTSGERRLLLLGAGTSDYLDGLFRPETASALATILLKHLASSYEDPPPRNSAGPSAAPHTRAWDKAFLAQLRRESPLLLQAELARCCVFDAEPCSVVPVSGRQQLSSKLRGNLSRYARRA